jgi:type IV pilus assembly protein PilC
MEWILVAWPTLILLGLGLRMALRLCYGARGPAVNDPIYDFISLVSWVLIGLGLIPAMVASIYSFIGLIILIIASVSLVEIVVQHRAAQRRSVCSLLGLYLARRMHLDASVLMSTYSLRGIVGRAARRMFADLDKGVPLATAVSQHPRALPRGAVAYVGSGATIQAEAAALKELNRSDEREITTLWRSCMDRLLYLCCVLVVLVGVLVFLMIKIVPVFRDIFQEFGLNLPAMTELAISVSDYFVTFLAVPTLIVLPMAIFSALVVAILLICDVPILEFVGDELFRNRRNADILRILAVAADERQPLSQVLDWLAVVYPSSVASGRLGLAAESVRAGGVWQDALARQRLIRPAEAALLKSAEQTGNLPWALRNVADRRERQSIYRMTVALQVVYPMVIILLGCVVAFFVVSLFIPTITLIQNLA